MVRSPRRAFVLGTLLYMTAACGSGGGDQGSVAGDAASPDGTTHPAGGDSQASPMPDATQPTDDSDVETDASASQGGEGGSAQDGAPKDEASSGDDGASIEDAGATSDAGPEADASDAAVASDAGGDAAVTGTVDAGQVGDASADGGASPEAGSVTEAGVTVDAGCSLADNCVLVPTGWQLVAFAPSQADACPPGFEAPTDFVEGPDVTNGCACGACTTTTPPNCAGGTVTTPYGNGVSSYACIYDGDTFPNSPAGACNHLEAQESYSRLTLSFINPPAGDGVCSAPTELATGTVTYAHMDRSCTPNGNPSFVSCTGDACVVELSGSSYGACITPETPGVAACPAGPLGVQHLVGSGTTYSCTACGCKATGTCSGGTLTLYSDLSCTMNPVTLTGPCTAFSGTSGNPTAIYGSAKFTGGTLVSTVTCASTPGTAKPVLTSETTVCCAN